MVASLSASGLPRAQKCPAAFALPVCREESSAEAQRGTAVHSCLELIAAGKSLADALASVGDPDARALCAKIDTRTIPQGEPEVRLAYHVRTGVARVLAGEGHRDYTALEADEIAGTADLVCWNETPVRVVDWKSSFGDFDIEQARAQLELYALAVARIAGVDTVRWSIGVISEEGSIGWLDCTLNADALATVAAKAFDAWESVRRERATRERLGAAYEPDTSIGWWCRYCSAFRACPAIRREVQLVTGRFVSEVKDDDLGEAYKNAKIVERAVEALRSTTKLALKKTNALPTGDGREVVVDSRGSLRFRRVA